MLDMCEEGAFYHQPLELQLNLSAGGKLKLERDNISADWPYYVRQGFLAPQI